MPYSPANRSFAERLAGEIKTRQFTAKPPPPGGLPPSQANLSTVPRGTPEASRQAYLQKFSQRLGAEVQTSRFRTKPLPPGGVAPSQANLSSVPRATIDQARQQYQQQVAEQLRAKIQNSRVKLNSPTTTGTPPSAASPPPTPRTIPQSAPIHSSASVAVAQPPGVVEAAPNSRSLTTPPPAAIPILTPGLKVAAAGGAADFVVRVASGQDPRRAAYASAGGLAGGILGSALGPIGTLVGSTLGSIAADNVFQAAFPSTAIQDPSQPIPRYKAPPSYTNPSTLQQSFGPATLTVNYYFAKPPSQSQAQDISATVSFSVPDTSYKAQMVGGPAPEYCPGNQPQVSIATNGKNTAYFLFHHNTCHQGSITSQSVVGPEPDPNISSNNPAPVAYVPQFAPANSTQPRPTSLSGPQQPLRPGHPQSSALAPGASPSFVPTPATALGGSSPNTPNFQYQPLLTPQNSSGNLTGNSPSGIPSATGNNFGAPTLAATSNTGGTGSTPGGTGTSTNTSRPSYFSPPATPQLSAPTPVVPTPTPQPAYFPQAGTPQASAPTAIAPTTPQPPYLPPTGTPQLSAPVTPTPRPTPQPAYFPPSGTPQASAPTAIAPTTPQPRYLPPT